VGTNILAGQILKAGQAAAELNQYYGQADTAQTTVTGTSYANLSSQYSIPAGEANYAGATYELTCAGYGTQGSTAQQLFFQMMHGTALAATPEIGTGAFSASQAFQWSLTFRMVCADGVSAWWCDLVGSVAESSAALSPGATGQESVAIAAANTTVHTAAVSSSIPVAIQAKWNATTGGPTITCTHTLFRKVA
jgi:hypothetical protein